MEYFLIVLVIASIISYLIDTNKECADKSHKLYANAVLFFHHFINIFANFGWLSNNKAILIFYLLTPIIVLIHWTTNNNKCMLTQLHNKLCNRNDSKEFNDLFNIVGMKKYSWWNKWGHLVYLGICFGIAIMKLKYMNEI